MAAAKQVLYRSSAEPGSRIFLSGKVPPTVSAVTTTIAPRHTSAVRTGRTERNAFKKLHRKNVRDEFKEAKRRAPIIGDSYRLVFLPARLDLAWLRRRNDGSRIKIDLMRGDREHNWLMELYDDERPSCFALEFGVEPIPADPDGNTLKGLLMPAVTFTRVR